MTPGVVHKLSGLCPGELNIKYFSSPDKPRMLFFLLIKVEQEKFHAQLSMKKFYNRAS